VEGCFEEGEQQCDCQLLKKVICAARGLLFFVCVVFNFFEPAFLYGGGGGVKGGSEYCTLAVAH